MSPHHKSKEVEDFTSTHSSELAYNLTSKRKPKALAAISTAIALRTASAFSDVQDASADGGVVPGRGTAWGTAYAAARMTVEITKESSDMFPPLKTVAGAIFVLIRSHDVGVYIHELNMSSSHTPLVPANIR